MHCYAYGCTNEITGHGELMCPQHWALVPNREKVSYSRVSLQHGNYTLPTCFWFAAACNAVSSVAEKEGFDKGAAHYRRMASGAESLIDAGLGMSYVDMGGDIGVSSTPRRREEIKPYWRWFGRRFR